MRFECAQKQQLQTVNYDNDVKITKLKMQLKTQRTRIKSLTKEQLAAEEKLAEINEECEVLIPF